MVDIQINTPTTNYVSVYRAFGLLYLSSDNILEAPTNGFESTSYIDEPGEHIYNKTTAAAFDYKVKFLVEAPNKNLVSANSKIKAFNDAFRSVDENGVQTITKITLFNTYKRVKIVGYPSPISSPTSFFRDKNGVEHDAVEVELTIRVDNPQECDFDFSDGTASLSGYDLQNVWYGSNLQNMRIFGPEFGAGIRGLKIPIKQGDAINITTNAVGTARAWAFSVDGRTLESAADESSTLQDYELTSPINGWLYVNCKITSLKDFNLTITPQNTISIQDDTTNL